MEEDIDPTDKLSQMAGEIHQAAYDAAMKKRGEILKGYEDAYWDIELTLKLRELGADWKTLREAEITHKFEVEET